FPDMRPLWPRENDASQPPPASIAQPCKTRSDAMQVRATGKTSFRASARLPLHLLRCTVLTGVASAAFMGSGFAQEPGADVDMCAQPMSPADQELCELVQDTLLLD